MRDRHIGMCRSLFRIVWPVVSLSLLAFSAAAQADEPEPLTFSVSSSRETCTLGSATTLVYLIDGGAPPYQVTVDGRVVEDTSSPNYIICRPSAIWSPLEEPGGDGIQRISVSVSDAAGARAYAVAEVQLVPPLPAPTYLRMTSSVDGRAAAELTAEWRTVYVPHARRTGDVAIRWRIEGTREWNVEHHRGERVRGRGFPYRVAWRIDSPPTGEQREVQVAQIRHIHDLLAPVALRWSASTLVTIGAPPHRLQAETTHDAITLSWGPHASRLVYVARLEPALVGRHTDRQTLRVTSGPVYEAHFGDLLPDTLYRVEVALAQGSRHAQALEQHRLEIRTEPAPLGWSPPSRQPTEISATIIDREMEVTWTPPATAARHETSVCAHRSLASWESTCDHVAPGQADIRLPLHSWHVLGGTFLITVQTRTTPAGVAVVELHVPSYSRDLPTRGAPAPAPQFHELSWFHHPHNPKPGTWRFEWEHQDADLAEVSWQEEGRTIIREVDRGHVSINMGYGEIPDSVRVRLLEDDSWTPWSAPADVPNIAKPVFPVRITERLDVLEVQWDPPPDDSEVVGYRLYVARNDGAEEVIEVGRRTRAEIPIRPTDERYRMSVSALIQGPIEMGRSLPNWHERQGQLQPVELRLALSAEYSPCPPAPRAPLAVTWSVLGGTPPFTVSIGELLGFETEVSRGSIVVECRVGADGLMLDVPGSVVDANGETASATLGLRHIYYPVPEPGLALLAVEFGQLRVHRDHVLLSWDCRYWPYNAVLRWRQAGQDDWTYAPDFPQHREPRDEYRRCRGSLDGLKPLTVYEYQLAKHGQIGRFRYPEHLQWSQSQSVTTLGPPQALSLERDGETVVVSWQRQPDAWAYVVGLRGQGRSWWKRHEPSGQSSEAVYFCRVPSDVALSVELINLWLRGGAGSMGRGYEAFWISAE